MSLNGPSTPLSSIRHANVQRRVSFGPRDLIEQPLKPKGLQIPHLDSPERKSPEPLPIPEHSAIPASPLVKLPSVLHQETHFLPPRSLIKPEFLQFRNPRICDPRFPSPCLPERRLEKFGNPRSRPRK